MSEKYKVVNPSSLFNGWIGKRVALNSVKEVMLVFDGPRGDVHAMFHPSEIINIYGALEIIECKDCEGSGFSKAGTGYDSVCDECGGKGEHPKY